MPGTQASPCAALARRLRCVRMAPFGLPVVPLVYCSTAVSPIAGPGWPAGNAFAPTTSRQSIAPGLNRPVVRADRASRAFFSGSRSSSRFFKGIPALMSTEITVVTPISPGKARIESTTLSQAIAIVAP